MRYLLDVRSMGVSPVMGIEPLLKDKRDEILQIAYRHGAKNLRLFGSMARGDASESSDVDILVEVGETLSPWFPGGLIADLEELLGRKVHVVTVGALHSNIRDRVLQEAVPLCKMIAFISFIFSTVLSAS